MERMDADGGERERERERERGEVSLNDQRGVWGWLFDYAGIEREVENKEGFAWNSAGE